MGEHEAKPWRCPRGHVLGQVMRNGSKVRRLMLYREAVDLEVELPEEVDIVAAIEGYAADVRCSVCGEVRTWVPGEEALKLMMERRNRTLTPSPSP